MNDKSILYLPYLGVFAFCLFYPEIAMAANNTPMGNVLCTVVGWMQGNLGKGLEAIGMTIIGISALMGKITWGTALMEGIACAVIFGAAQIVERMGANAMIGCPVI